MKRKIIATTLSALTILLVQSSAALAGKGLTCYDVEGTVETTNVSDTVQIGTIHLVLRNQSTGDIEFNEEGSLVGNITGTDGIPTTILTHTAKFSPGNRFTTRGDVAIVTGVEKFVSEKNGDLILDGNGYPIPCSFSIRETITDLRKGSEFFAKAKRVEQNIIAEGYVSKCPDESQNWFELSGKFCKK